jgi:hypothetical protein
VDQPTAAKEFAELEPGQGLHISRIVGLLNLRGYETGIVAIIATQMDGARRADDVVPIKLQSAPRLFLVQQFLVQFLAGTRTDALYFDVVRAPPEQRSVMANQRFGER